MAGFVSHITLTQSGLMNVTDLKKRSKHEGGRGAMSSKYSHDQVLQSIQPNRKKYKAISLSTAITMELEDLMENKGISKKELAAAAGVSPSYLSQVFSGDKLINISMLAGISNEFNVVFRMEIQDKKSEEFLYQDRRDDTTMQYKEE